MYVGLDHTDNGHTDVEPDQICPNGKVVARGVIEKENDHAKSKY